MPLCLALLATLASTGGACSSPAAPTPPTAITIAPTISILKVGQQETLRVVAAPDGSAALAATWTSDNPAVATVDGRGQLVGVAAGAATISATFHGRAVNQTLTVVPDYAGSWTGLYKVATCIRISGPGTHPCRFILGGGGSAPLELQLAQTGRDVSGTLALSNLEIFNIGAVSGEVRPDGTLGLEGLLRLPGFDAEMRVVSWTSSIQPPGNSLEGTHTVESRGANAFGVQVLRLEHQLVNVTRR